MTALAEEIRSTVPVVGENIPAYTLTEALPAPPKPDEEGYHRNYVDIIVSKVFDSLSVEAGTATQIRYVGKVIRARRSASPEQQWIADGHYLHGTELNPAPQHDHHYRLLNGNKALVRYDANVDRWWVIKGEGDIPWHAADDFYSMTPSAYFEVVYSGELTNLDPELTEVREFAPASRFHDKAVVVDGVVEEVTSFVDGVLYVGYSESDSNSAYDRLYFGMKLTGRDEPVSWGRCHYMYGGSSQTPELNDAFPTDMRWAKAVLPDRVTTTSSTATVEVLERATEDRKRGFEAFNDALNELADEQDWCGQYERVMDSIGMRSRRKQKIRIGVNVDVDLNITVDDPRYQINSTLSSEYDVDTVSNLRLDARVQVTVYVVQDRDDDYDEGFDEDADSYNITQSQVSDELESRLSHSGWEIEDWNTTGDAFIADDQDDLD